VLVPGEEDAGGEFGDGSGNEFGGKGDSCAELSDWNDCDLPPIGIVRLFSADSRFLSRLLILWAS
jgi:hypothetical protein